MALLGALAAAVAFTACSDSSVATAPNGSPHGASLALAPVATPTSSRVVSEQSVGDTAVLVFVVGTGPSTFSIDGRGSVVFPNAMASICDPATSSYGVGTWDSPCRAATKPVEITAKLWTNAAGRTQMDFQPALRFVPGLAQSVTLWLKNSNGGTRIDYCAPRGCINEALNDRSQSTNFDGTNGSLKRAIKHFSGYTVTAD